MFIHTYAHINTHIYLNLTKKYFLNIRYLRKILIEEMDIIGYSIHSRLENNRILLTNIYSGQKYLRCEDVFCVLCYQYYKFHLPLHNLETVDWSTKWLIICFTLYWHVCIIMLFYRWRNEAINMAEGRPKELVSFLKPMFFVS